MIDQMRADNGAVSGKKIQNTWRNARFFEDLHEHGAADDRLLGWFHDHGVTRYDPGRCHSAENCDGKIPRRDHEGDAARPVMVVTFLAGNLLSEFGASESPHLLGVEPAKIDRFADVSVRFVPRFAHFEDFNC